MAPADAPCLDDPRCAASSSDERVAEPGKAALVLLALAMGGFAIGVTEFAAMSVLPDFAAGLGVSEPRPVMSSALMPQAWSSGRRSWPCWARACRAGCC
jgi:hypothetical protein